MYRLTLLLESSSKEVGILNLSSLPPIGSEIEIYEKVEGEAGPYAKDGKFYYKDLDFDQGVVYEIQKYRIGVTRDAILPKRRWEKFDAYLQEELPLELHNVEVIVSEKEA